VRYRLTLAYDGGRFAGWQRQPNAETVQERLEAALEEICGERPSTCAAGRTDAGVHAEGQVVSFDLARPLPAATLVSGTNHFLRHGVRVLDAAPAPDEFNARRDAVAKVYRYRLRRGRIPPADAPYVVPAPDDLDRGRLEASAFPLIGRHDFSAFALAGGAAQTSVRRIFAAAWEERGPELVFRITGEGFLRGMVRCLVGTMLEVGIGRRSLEELTGLLAGGPRSLAGPTAPARGLCLERVDTA
jgi:tRNA pseudouridine38-40 synthase